MGGERISRRAAAARQFWRRRSTHVPLAALPVLRAGGCGGIALGRSQCQSAASKRPYKEGLGKAHQQVLDPNRGRPESSPGPPGPEFIRAH